jgi:hypothetical protein
MASMDEDLRAAIDLFNSARYDQFQDALERMISGTRATSERSFYAVLDNLAESIVQLGDADHADAEDIIGPALRRLDEFLPRFRGINVAALKHDFEHLLGEVRAMREKGESAAPSRLPRIRILPG